MFRSTYSHNILYKYFLKLLYRNLIKLFTIVYVEVRIGKYMREPSVKNIILQCIIIIYIIIND